MLQAARTRSHVESKGFHRRYMNIIGSQVQYIYIYIFIDTHVHIWREGLIQALQDRQSLKVVGPLPRAQG